MEQHFSELPEERKTGWGIPNFWKFLTGNWNFRLNIACTSKIFPGYFHTIFLRFRLLPIHTLFKVNFITISMQNLFTSRVVFTKDALEMWQNIKLTYKAIFFLLIKPFLWWRSRCHSRRVFLKLLFSRWSTFCLHEISTPVAEFTTCTFHLTWVQRNRTYKFFWNSSTHLHSRSRCHLQCPL